MGNLAERRERIASQVLAALCHHIGLRVESWAKSEPIQRAASLSVQAADALLTALDSSPEPSSPQERRAGDYASGSGV
jgi:hypothetical protein